MMNEREFDDSGFLQRTVLTLGRYNEDREEESADNENDDQEVHSTLTYLDIMARNQESLSTLTNTIQPQKHFVDSLNPQFQRVLVTPTGMLMP
jgi:hypothetical protein